MKKVVLVGLLCWLGLAGTAEAGLGDWAKNSWTYLFQPVNAVAQLGKDLAVCTTASLGRFITTVAGNVNRNPATLQPVFTVQ